MKSPKGLWVVLVVSGVLLGMVIAALQYPNTGAPTVSANIVDGPETAVTYPSPLQNLPGRPTHFAIEHGSGSLWFPSILPSGENRLYRFDPKTETLSDWQLPSDPGEGLFVGVAFDQRNDLWIAWDQTLARFDTATHEVTRYAIPTDSPYSLDVEGTWVRDLALTADGTVWLSRHHTASLLAFDPSTATFTETALEGFGVPDRIKVAEDGRLWLTLARDPGTHQEFTKIAVFSPVTKKADIISEQASSIALDAQGQAVLAGNPSGLTTVDPSGKVATRAPLAHPASASDLVITAPNGQVVVTNRVGSSALVYDPASRQWSIYKFQTQVGQVQGPKGYDGPVLLESVAEVTDLAFDSEGHLWVLIPGYAHFAKVRL